MRREAKKSRWADRGWLAVPEKVFEIDLRSPESSFKDFEGGLSLSAENHETDENAPEIIHYDTEDSTDLPSIPGALARTFS